MPITPWLRGYQDALGDLLWVCVHSAGKFLRGHFSGSLQSAIAATALYMGLLLNNQTPLKGIPSAGKNRYSKAWHAQITPEWCSLLADGIGALLS